MQILKALKHGLKKGHEKGELHCAALFLWTVYIEMEKCNEANIRKIYHTLCRTSAKGQKLQMGKIKEIFSVIKEEIESSAEKRATFAKIEKKVEETKIAENADYAREKYRQRGYKTQVVFEAVMHMLYIMAGGLAGAYITHCIYKYDMLGVSSLCADIGPDRITFLQLIVDVLPICLSVKLFLMARQPLYLIIWRVKSKIYAPIFIN